MHNSAFAQPRTCRGPRRPPGAGDAAATPPVGLVGADARPQARDGGASAGAAKALRRDIDARGDKLRANRRSAGEAMATLEANIAKADKKRAAELEAGKKQLAERIASDERQLVQVDKDLKALDARDTSADQFQPIMARQNAGKAIAKSSEGRGTAQLGRGDGRLARLVDQATRSGPVSGAHPNGRSAAFAASPQGPWAALRRWPRRPVWAARRASPKALGHPGAGASHSF